MKLCSAVPFLTSSDSPRRMPPFPATGVAEILRSAQKDELYSDQLSKEISELSLEVLGPRAWLRWKAHIEAMAAFAYLSTTTLCDLQTLGEEYAGLLQVIGQSWARN